MRGIVNLCDRSEWIADVAATHVTAFGGLLPDWTLAQAEQELQLHQRDAIPMTWLLEDSTGWLGSVSLLQEDHDDIPHYSPWLASLYVQPRARGAGVARELVSHCVAEAARLGITRLYLYCAEALVEFYQAMGWQIQTRLPLHPLSVVVMVIQPPTPISALSLVRRSQFNA